MRFYSTKYTLKDPIDSTELTFGSCIYASSYCHACKLAVDRNIGEIVVGVLKSSDYDPCPFPSCFYKQREIVKCLHTLTFYGWIASMSNVLDLRSFCNDLGLLHEVMHELHHPEIFKFRQRIYDQMVHLETLIPGLKTYRNLVKESQVDSR